MKRNTSLICVAACLSIGLAGCHKDDPTVITVQSAPSQSPSAAGGAKPSGGAVFSPRAVPAPSSVQSGNYDGGKKD